MINKIFPFMKWIKSYNQKDFISDFVAGTVLAIILIPKSIAYASIAGLPPVY
jgi:MFS superfamily sulfate permease-like transporter